MKNLFLIALLLTGFVSRGQYFQHLYGTSNPEQRTTGVNTIAQPQGHFMAASTATGSGLPAIIAAYADNTGNISGAPFFNNTYTIGMAASSPYFVDWPRVFELDNGSGFGVVGKYSDPTLPSPNSGVFYLQLDPMGNILSTINYAPVSVGAYSWDVITVGGIAESATGNELYITGSMQELTSTNDINIYIMKIDVNSGTLLWSEVLDVVNPVPSATSRDWAYDVIESPYSPVGYQEAIVVGATYDNSGTITADGFVVRVDANTGALILPWAVLYGTSSTQEYFTSITVANSTTGGGNGFVIGGQSTAGTTGSWDYWLVKTDQSCWSSYWATIHDYSVNPGAQDYCNDVIERLNISGVYEYYMGGTTDQGYFGNWDALVIKTDDWGNGVAGGEFTYGSNNFDEATRLDQYNGTPFDGLSVYGSATFAAGLGNADMYLVKAYFDGQSGCNEYFSNPNPATGPGLLGEYTLDSISDFNSSILNAWLDPESDYELCNTSSIPGASNARIAPTEPKGDKQAIVSPNPMAQGSPVAVVELEAETNATVQVVIYDILGKQYYNGQFTLVKGKNQLPVDISNTNMATGMYTIKVNSTTINKNILLIVK